MQDIRPQDTSGMLGRYVLFIVLSIGLVLLSAYLNVFLNPPKPQAERQEAGQGPIEEPGPQKEGAGKPDAGEEKAKPESVPPKPTGDQPSPEQQGKPKPDSPVEKPRVRKPPRISPKPRLMTLGSQDPKGPFRMLVSVTNVGAAIERIELNSQRFPDLEDRSGYLGHLVLDETVQGKGCPVEVVGPGTPAAQAGLRRGDLITQVEGQPVTGYESLRKELQKTRPGQDVTLTVLRDGNSRALPVTLRRRPLELVRPEVNGRPLDGIRPGATDPLSFLLTLSQVDGPDIEGQTLEDLLKDDENEEEEEPEDNNRRGDKQREDRLFRELEGLDLRTGTWDIENEAQFDDAGPHKEITFFRELPEFGLKISKTFRLAEVPEKEKDETNPRAYHLELRIKIENTGRQARQVAYQLDGATGLPIEGKWYANKVSLSRSMFASAGLRDVVHAWQGKIPIMTSCATIADDNLDKPWEEQDERKGREEQLLAFIGVDAQYFSAVLIPQREGSKEVWFAKLQPLRVGAVNKLWKTTTNTSCRLTSTVQTLKPDGAPLEHTFTVFAGPKKPRLLDKYGLNELVYYGWYGWVAKPMVWALHGFYALVGNYGLAIFMLTVLVRSCMFPLSRKQVLGAQKMQELQPELRKLQEKYKNNWEARAKAQRDLFKKHNYHPASGCLVLFLQLPIFVGLYRGLMVDVELRGAPLLSQTIRWCSNLAAPDMLIPWSGFMPSFVTDNPSGNLLNIFFLGPYFNLLPILTVAFFLVQQKMLMPPPTDDQGRMQRKVMTYMMVFMGFIFFKVSSGLCLYFIASSLWGLAERKLLPKVSRPDSGTSPPKPASPKAAAGKPAPAAPGKPVKPKPAPPRPAQPTATRVGSRPDGAPRRKKKKKKKRSRGRK